jgi:hypothetical protein
MGYDSKEQANGFSFVKANDNGTYSLLEMYSSSDGALKPKTFYNSKKSIGGQVMNLLKKSQPYTSGTRTRPIDTLKPEVMLIISHRFSNSNKNFQQASPPKKGGSLHLRRSSRRLIALTPNSAQVR